MREAERPITERVSVFDRPPNDDDAFPGHLETMLGRVDPSSVRLTHSIGSQRLYLGRSASGDELFKFYFDTHGGGGGGGPRSGLVTHGASVAWAVSEDRCVAYGIVPDAVVAVRVGDVDAVVANNAFMADGAPLRSRIVLTTAEGERVLELPGPGRLEPREGLTATTDGPGYSGLVEYAASGYSHIEIDDLDAPNWLGTIAGSFIINGNAPDVWRVGVVLLEGPRAGEFGEADLIVRRDAGTGDRSVQFVGQAPFVSHPDPPRLASALQNLHELQSRFGRH